MKLHNPLAVLVFLLGVFMGQSALATTPIANCDILYAGQNSNAGEVCVSIDADVGTVSIDYELATGWSLSEVHAWIGEDRALMPQNRKGNPQVGHFPHSATGLGGVSSYSFVIPLSDLPINADTFCGAEVFVAAHAVVSRNGSGKGGKTGTESAWAGSNQIGSGGSWARYFSFTNDYCDDDEDSDYPVVVLPAGCFNVFGQGVTSITEPVATVGITPVGVTDTGSAWLNTYSSSTRFFGGDLVTGNGNIVGSFLAGLIDTSIFGLELSLDSSASPALKIRSANAYFDTAGLYQNMSPLDYGLSMAGNGTGQLGGTWGLTFEPEQIDTIVHAVICPSTVAD